MCPLLALYCRVVYWAVVHSTRQRQAQTGKIFFSFNPNDTVFVCLCRYLSVTGYCEFEHVETAQEYFVVSCRAMPCRIMWIDPNTGSPFLWDTASRRSPETFFNGTSTLEDERPLRSLGTSGTSQPVTRRCTPEERKPQLYRCESLKTRYFNTFRACAHGRFSGRAEIRLRRRNSRECWLSERTSGKELPEDVSAWQWVLGRVV